MNKFSRKLLSGVVVLLLGLAGVLLCLVLNLSLNLNLSGPAWPVEAQDFRVMQVWPDHSVGITSGLLEGSTAPTATQVLPFGVYRTAEGDVVRGRTYLHFPLDVFPPGTEIVRATLYVYVDSGSDAGEATLGVYRALEPWGEVDWGSDPATWPALLSSPVAVTTARFDVMTPTLPVSVVVSTATPTSTLAPTATPTPGAALTPTLTPTPTPAPISTPLAWPSPTPTLSPALTVPVVLLRQVTGTWLTWDVTVLVRAWLADEAPDDGLALAPAPGLDVAPDAAGGLLLARWLTAADADTKPYFIAEFEVHPVTPTPVPTPTPPTSPLSTPASTPAPILPPAGSPVGWGAAGLLLVVMGEALLALGLTRWGK
jgi:hypothetical protein